MDTTNFSFRNYYDQYIRGSSWDEVVPENTIAEIDRNL
jgi:hypothetical protein